MTARRRIWINCAIALALFPAGALAATNWSLSQNADPLNDQNVAIAAASYADGIFTRSAIVRCTGKKLEVFVDFGEFIDSSANLKLVPIRYRFDKGPLVEDKWLASATGTAVFADEGRDMARQILGGTTFVMEVEDFRGQPHRALFDLVGANVPVGKVLEQCGVSQVGLETKVPGLRKEIALDLERWNPQKVLVGKKILNALGAYNGQLDSTIEPGFALAAQTFYDAYVAKCKAGTWLARLGGECASIPAWSTGENLKYVRVGDIIYELAPSELKEEFGQFERF